MVPNDRLEYLVVVEDALKERQIKAPWVEMSMTNIPTSFKDNIQSHIRGNSRRKFLALIVIFFILATVLFVTCQITFILGFWSSSSTTTLHIQTVATSSNTNMHSDLLDSVPEGGKHFFHWKRNSLHLN